MTSSISDKAKKNQRVQKKESVRTFTKIIIRNLPPTMSEEEFIQQTEPLPNHDFYYYCMADWSLGLEATCRAYLTVRDLDDVFLFRNRFDGYVFVDSKGVEYIAIVEYAPFQGFQKKKSRNNDNKENTIESEPHYQQYLEKIEKERDELTHCGDLKTDFTLDRKVEDKITSTPLLQYLASKKEKRREEAKKRIDAKRKHREEEKQKQSQQKTKVSQMRIDAKIICQNNDKNIQNKEEYKISRTKRRAERDRKRREEHEQRKKVRELQNSDQNLKLNNVNEQKHVRQNSLRKHDKGITLLRKIQSDGSDHNATNQDNGKEQTNKNILNIKRPNEQIDQSKSEDKRISETVNNFISNCAGVDTSKDPSLIDKSEFGITQILSKCNSQKIQTQHSFEERRIKNKDRPSIAIYQPKARLRITAEREVKSETLEGNNCSADPKHEKSQKLSSCKKIGRRIKLNLSNSCVDNKCDTRKSSDDGKDNLDLKGFA